MTETAQPVAGTDAAATWTADEMMSIAASRALRDGQACFVGIGLPSTAANLARRLHAPRLVLIYESGTLDTRPDELPLSIGDGILADAALSVVSVPEIFNYWLQPGRIDIGFLSGAQIDRLGNINTTVIGEYDEPSVRLPGSGGAPEIAASCREVIVVMRHRRRAFEEQVDFVTSVGHGTGPGDRKLLGLRGAGPVRVITDLGVLEPDPDTAELVLTALHQGVTVEHVRAETDWPLQVSADLVFTAPPSTQELSTLRSMRTVGEAR
jgi:glutaconate CoA-transferase subunit B